MIDTVRFRTLITEKQKEIVEKIGRRTESYEVATGEYYYSFTNSNLKGSWDTNIQLKVQEKVVVGEIYKYALYVECSLHKLILGHNCFGGSDDLYSQLLFLQDVLLKELQLYVSLDKITITRIDYAFVYRLQNQTQSVNYIKQFHMALYRNKEPTLTKETSVFWKTQNWSFKIYDKLSDFNVHDFKKSKFTVSFYKSINGILRVETTFRKKQLEKMHYKKDLKVQDINIELLKEFTEDKIFYFEKQIGNKSTRKTVTDFEEVMNRLYSNPDITKRKAANVLNSYNIIRLIGTQGLRKTLKSSAYYDHKKILENIGVDIVNNTINNKLENINKNKKLWPEDFTLINKKYRILDDDIDCYLKVAL
jgi:II/X family phage/plasmid replication protein